MRREQAVLLSGVLALAAALFLGLTAVYGMSTQSAGAAALGVAVLAVVEFVLDESSL